MCNFLKSNWSKIYILNCILGTDVQKIINNKFNNKFLILFMLIMIENKDYLWAMALNIYFFTEKT